MKRRFVRVSLLVFLAASLYVGATVALQPGRGLLDFGAFYMAGETYNRGVDPYAVYPEIAEASGYDFGYDDGRGHSPNLNPPISLYPFSLIPGLGAGQVRTGLNAVSMLAFAACAVALLRSHPEHRSLPVVLWLAAFGAFWYTVWLGQIYVLLFALALGAWFALRRGANPLLAAALIGLLVAIKPNFGLWPVFLLLAGQPRVGLTALGVAAGISAVPLVLEGPGVYGQWLAAVEAYPRVALAGNASIIGVSERLGLGVLGYAASGALVVGAGLLVWRLRPSAGNTSAWAIIVTLLASPISWIGYSLMALPVLLARRWQAWEWTAALCMTGFWFFVARGEMFILASMILLGLLASDAVRARAASRGVARVRAMTVQRERAAA